MEYISTADTAKLIRKELKERFPGQKFSVRSKSYAGGSSIDVRWGNGVSPVEVDKVIKKYEGSEFDGMIDLKSPKDVPYLVDFVFGHREVSVELRQRIVRDLAKLIDEPFVSLNDFMETQGQRWGELLYKLINGSNLDNYQGVRRTGERAGLFEHLYEIY